MSGNIDRDNSPITLANYPKAIVHIDADAFFTSCEQSRDTSLKGRPVVTGKERGIVSCASYEAKRYGIQRGTILSEARRLCPSVIILSSDYELYSIYSERMFNIIKRFTPDVEEFSIDEFFCDLTGLRRIYRSSYSKIARQIKERIKAELDITVSVGLSLSKTLAKICSGYNKPDGFTVLPGKLLHIFLRDVSLAEVCGFGPNTVELLNKYGIYTALEYIKRPSEFVYKILGKVGIELWCELRGEYIYKVSEGHSRKYLTISKTKTFMPSSSDMAFVKGQLVRNIESACIRLRRHRLSARMITIYLRSYDFNETILQADLNRHSSSTLDFIRVGSELFEKIFDSTKKYRATGVILSDIIEEGCDDKTLFDDEVKIKKLKCISDAIDKINRRFGKHTIHIASSNIITACKNPHSRNDLPWRKKMLLQGETFRRRIKIPLIKLATHSISK